MLYLKIYDIIDCEKHNKKRREGKMKKISIVFCITTLSLVLTAPSFVYASEDIENQSKISTKEAISEIDSVGIEISEEENNEPNVRLLRAAAYKNKTFSYKRGGVAAWCKDFISFKYNGSTVKENAKWQEAGWLFPNVIRKKGIVNYQNGNTYKDYVGTKTYKIGTPTPWGDISVASFDRSDYYRIQANGKAYKK